MREQGILSRRALASAIPLAVLTAAPAAVLPALTTARADDAVVDLGRRWQAAVEAEQAQGRLYSLSMSDAEATEHEAIGDELHDATSALYDRIARTPATTLAGLAAKARVLAYANDVERLDEASISAALDATPYLVDRAAFSLALDILRFARAAS